MQKLPLERIIYDHKGSVQVVVNESGSKVEETFYSPFGEIISGGATSRFDYEGKEYDSVVGDYDYHARKVNPQWGMFTQPDTLLTNVYDTQQLNRYTFEKNNPYNYIDPKGKVAKSTINRKTKTIKVEATIYVYGKGASQKAAKKMHWDINKAWSNDNVKVSGESYKVITNVNVIFVKEKPSTLKGYENAVELKGFFEGITHKSYVSDKREGVWSSSNPGNPINAIVHETGHLFGLKDRYNEDGSAEAGYEDSIMSARSETASPADFNNLLGKALDRHNAGYSDYYDGEGFIMNRRTEGDVSVHSLNDGD